MLIGAIGHSKHVQHPLKCPVKMGAIKRLSSGGGGTRKLGEMCHFPPTRCPYKLKMENGNGNSKLNVRDANETNGFQLTSPVWVCSSPMTASQLIAPSNIHAESLQKGVNITPAKRRLSNRRHSIHSKYVSRAQRERATLELSSPRGSDLSIASDMLINPVDERHAPL